MGHPRRNSRYSRGALCALGSVLVLLFGGFVAEASDDVPADLAVISVPAEFVHSLRLPGIADHINRPSALFVDHAHGEVLVGDAGSNRLLIFDSEGLFRYQFDFTDKLGLVVDIAVDTSGFVYILGSAPEGRKVLRYDFDGVFLNEVRFEEFDPGRIESMGIDEEDHLVLVDADGTCRVVEATGELITSFDTTAGLGLEEAATVVRGKPRIHQGRLLLPMVSLGTVFVFDVDTGQRLSSIGAAGNMPGQLGAPAAVDVLPSGLVVVLDRLRFNVQCYAPSGRFVGEFGGRGYQDGWMYFPTLLSAVHEDRVIVGQNLDNRVQVLRIPSVVLERFSRELNAVGDETTEEEGMPEQGPPDSNSRTP